MAHAANHGIIQIIKGIFGDPPYDGFDALKRRNMDTLGQTTEINRYNLTVSEVQPGQFVEYKISALADPLAITYLRNYAEVGGNHTSTWAIFGYETNDEAEAGTLTLYKSYQQFDQADGAQIATLPSAFAPADSQGSYVSDSEGLEDLWDRTVRRSRYWHQFGGRRCKTRHRRRKTRHRRRKTRRSRR